MTDRALSPPAMAKLLAVEAEDGKLGLAVVRRFASEFEPPIPREPDAWLPAAAKAWEDAESKKGSERLAGRLDAAECFLRAGIVAEAIKQQWQTRIDSLETGADVVLWAKKATLKGPQIAYHNELDLIYRWSDPSAYVEWQTFLAAGKYDVGLEYRADRHMAPSSVMGIVVTTPSGSRSVYQDTFTLQRTGDEFAMYRTPKVLAVTAGGEYVVRLGVINKASSKSRTTIINPRSIQFRKR